MAILFAAVALAAPAAAAQLDGVTMPATEMVAGVRLRLNGMGERTYSFLGIPIYVAGLYVEQPTSDANAILAARDPRLLLIRFVHDADAERSRESWAAGLRANCPSPCPVPQHEIARFLAAIPDFRRGDTSSLLFTQGRVRITLNGRLLGEIADPPFARLILSAFLGPVPPSEPLKQALLGRSN